MYLFFSILIAIVSVLLILIVLVQNSKGGGLAANFSSQNQVMGVRKTTDFLEKATWTLALALLIFSLGASMSIPRAGANAQKTVLESTVENENVTEESNDLTAEPITTPATETEKEETPAE